MQASQAYPDGTVTFLFTDIEGSTALWERDRAAMQSVVDRHLTLIGDAVAAAGGVHFKTIGDAVQAAFHTAPDALEAALAAQRALLAEPWPEGIGALRVRMALHVGTARAVDGDYLAPALNRLARTLGIGHGEQILVTAAARGLLVGNLPPDVSLRSLGAHALRGLQDPEEVFQVVASGLRHDFPPLRSLPHHPTNLTVLPTPLIGRNDELSLVTRLLGQREARLVTLTGPGGAGKTRLVLEAAAELLDTFPAGVFFVDLSALRDPALVIPTIADTLGVREAPGQPLAALLSAHLGQQAMLLVLDNCEQVIDAASDLATLLAACPTLSLLATSREPLRIRAEREIPVLPLAIPAESETLSLDALAQIPAIALFVSRAQASHPGFILTDENAPAITEICRRLDGLPLAIELAAVRTRLLPPQELLARLDKSLAVLTGGARDLPARQRTLRNTIAWSHDLLSEEERALFGRLGVFVGGWTLEAAETVVNPDGEFDVFSGMDGLVEQSLVRFDERGALPRYSMLQTIREFAVEQLLASGETERLRQSHADYVMHITGWHRGQPVPVDRPDEEWVERMESEQDNLRSALSWWLDREDGASALRLAAAAGTFWRWRNHWTEGRTWLERALALAPDDDPVARVRAIAYAGSFALSKGDSQEAVALLSRGLAIPETPETRGWLMTIALRLAQAHSQIREFDRALTHYEHASALATAMKEHYTALEVRWSMAYAATSQGDVARARQIAEAVLADERQATDPLTIAQTLEVLAWVALAADDLNTAAARLAEAWREAGDIPPWAEAIRTNLLIDEAVLAYRREDYARSAAMVREWLPHARTSQSQQDLLLALLVFASIASRSDLNAEAARWFGALNVALAESGHGMHLEPAIQPWHEADMGRVRETLGAEAWTRAWTAGSRLPVAKALEEAEGAMARLFALVTGDAPAELLPHRPVSDNSA
jgi:predicted ATPase/class 3 adenylate cyclase